MMNISRVMLAASVISSLVVGCSAADNSDNSGGDSFTTTSKTYQSSTPGAPTNEPVAPTADAPAQAPAEPKLGILEATGQLDLVHSDSSDNVTYECSRYASVGDPHESNTCGAKWDNQLLGTFSAVKAMNHGDPLPIAADQASPTQKAARFMIIKTHTPWANSQATVNTKVGVLLGQSVVTYDLDKDTLVVNGKAFQGEAFKDWNKIDLPGNAFVLRRDQTNDNKITKTYLMVSPSGDKAQIDVKGNHLNIYGQVSTSRSAKVVRGSLGAYEGTANNAAARLAVSRDGKKTFDMSKPEEAKAFHEEWRATPQESIL